MCQESVDIFGLRQSFMLDFLTFLPFHSLSFFSSSLSFSIHFFPRTPPAEDNKRIRCCTSSWDENMRSQFFFGRNSVSATIALKFCIRIYPWWYLKLCWPHCQLVGLFVPSDMREGQMLKILSTPSCLQHLENASRNLRLTFKTLSIAVFRKLSQPHVDPPYQCVLSRVHQKDEKNLNSLTCLLSPDQPEVNW